MNSGSHANYFMCLMIAQSTVSLMKDISFRSFTLGVFLEESGKLECLAVVAHLGPHATIHCEVENVSTREDIPFWKSEPGVDAPPLANPALASSGQKVIQVSFKDTLNRGEHLILSFLMQFTFVRHALQR